MFLNIFLLKLIITFAKDFPLKNLIENFLNELN